MVSRHDGTVRISREQNRTFVVGTVFIQILLVERGAHMA